MTDRQTDTGTYFMYVDESGDPGSLDPSQPDGQQPSGHYILSGLILPVHRWNDYLRLLADHRRSVNRDFGYPVRTELKGSELINPRGNIKLKTLTRYRRVDLYKQALSLAANDLDEAKLLSIHVNKRNPKYGSTSSTRDLEGWAWECFVQRYETFLRVNGNSQGIIFADDTNEVKIRRIVRRMRHINYIPSRYGGSRSIPLAHVIEDPVMRDSRQSYFIQIADLAAHALYRKLYPKGSYRRYNVDKLFDLLEPILLHEASRSDPQGIVHL
jgi:hypothetical protein